MILVNSGAFLSISSWFCELTELIFVMIPYISSTGYPPKTQGIMGHVQSSEFQEQGSQRIAEKCAKDCRKVRKGLPKLRWRSNKHSKDSGSGFNTRF